jgi:hypothetical protein
MRSQRAVLLLQTAAVTTLMACDSPSAVHTEMASEASPMFAGASTPAELPSEIHACYIPGSGQIYRIQAWEAPHSCRGNHIPFSWKTNAGSDSGWELIKQTVTIGSDGFALLPCPSGKKAVNGGFRAIHPSGVEILATATHMGPDGIGWLTEGPPGVVSDAWVACVAT